MRKDPRKDEVAQLVTGGPNNSRESTFTTATEQTTATNQTGVTFEENGSVSPTVIYPMRNGEVDVNEPTNQGNSVRVINVEDFAGLKKGESLEGKKASLRKQIMGLRILTVFLIVALVAFLALAFI